MAKHLEQNNKLLNNPQVKEEISKEIKKYIYLTEQKWKYNTKFVGQR